MKMCDDHHDEIVYDSHNCPACELQKELKDCESTLIDWKNDYHNLEKEFAELEKKYETIRDTKTWIMGAEEALNND